MAEKSRAEYFKKRRQGMKQFNVTLEREKIEALENKLEAAGKTRKQWLSEKIDEELGQ